MIYISTGGFGNNTALEVIDGLHLLGITAVELSGGRHVSNVEQELKIKQEQLSLDLQIHNYFPPPKSPFVFNLASSDDEIVRKSLQHAKNSIKLARNIGSKIYSFHAGYLIDPAVDELGKSIEKKRINSRQESVKKFISRLLELATYAKSLEVELLIENNVLSQGNYKRFGCDPLLMTTPQESEYVMSSMPSNVNMLLDVGHLKVSANTLGYEPHLMFECCKEWIQAYHLSDNDGLEDQNKKIDSDSWFWKYLNRNVEYYSLEIYNVEIEELVRQKRLVEKEIGQT